MTMNKLLEFRTTYLRAVAEAWIHPEFKEALTGADPIGALRERFDYQWPWKHMALKIEDAASQYQWIGNEWIWSRGLPESLTIYLPLNPPARPGDPTKAIADYYRQRPLLFGDENVDGDPSDLMPADEEFAAFQVALIAAMAKGWHDPSFKAMLLVDGTTALGRIPGYKVPWDLNIHVEEDRWSTWGLNESEAPTESPKFKTCWKFHERARHLLKLYLPSRPSEPHSEPLALAMYNSTGAEYPFTCCPC